MQMAGGGIEREPPQIPKARVPQVYFRDLGKLESEGRVGLHADDPLAGGIEHEQGPGSWIDGHPPGIEETE